jgi:P-type conjugative transfer protein TrbG
VKKLTVPFALLMLCAWGLAAAQQGPLQLPPPTPAKPPNLAMPAPKAAAPLSVPAPSGAAAQAAPVQAPQGVVSKVATSPTPKRAKARKRPAARAAAAAPADPYADLPINTPAKQALGMSSAWANNGDASVARGADGRVVFTFGETMPTVVCAPLRICDIELQPGEKVMEQPHIGDDVRWSVSPGITGSGEGRTTHVIVKPSEPGLDTNLFIPTDRRMYRLRLVSSENNYVSVVSFYYPKDEKAQWDMALAREAVEEDEVAAELPSMSVDSLDFDYGVTLKRGQPRWKPIRVFNDGQRTYIQLPQGSTEQDAPAVVELTRGGQEQLVNFRFRGGYVVVDRVVERAALVSGVGGDAERVEIEHGCARRSWNGKCKG